MYLGLNSVLRSAGHPQKAMAATILTVVINTLLDPLFIYGFGMGIRGAAIATILAQIISLCWLIKIFCNKNELLHFRRGIYRLKGVLVENIIGIGLAPFFMNVASCIIVILINKGLKLYDGDLAIGAFGIVNRIVFLFVMIVMGLNQGMQPIAGYNFGARQFHRVNHVMKLTVIAATIVTSTGFLVGELIPELAVSAFTTDSKLIELSARGLRITVMFFPIIGFQMVTSNFSRVSEWQKGHYPFIKPTGADSYPMPADTSFILGSRRNLVQYADIRYPSQPDCRIYAIQPV